ncbi:hepatocyte growth factor-regulated tyrosine kinase substrate-like [Babylonia areolata]|uniref:hepatocyte growth factor-regulated tyrosine kinase substrate-like n=1 Tax=Babylonia areolata TaxID=304850 RepID=UPI003FD26AF2
MKVRDARREEKATSQLLLEPDLEATFQVVDAIRQSDVQPKTAVQAVRKKIVSDNPHVTMFALGVLEACVKNCGAPVHREIATREFMEFFRDQAKMRPDPVKEKVLELLQAWAHALRSEPNYKIIEDTYNLMKMEGFQFPHLKDSDAMFRCEKAPELQDGDHCVRCFVHFNLVQRKHNCRHCGDVFCQKCASKNSIIPKFGIEREVRVCDQCFDILRNP